ncbi:zinc-finger domain-containing protein [Clostridioides difficile]|nr:zinc-finger domain-containing protein [Clostridioides difficile]
MESRHRLRSFYCNHCESKKSYNPVKLKRTATPF